MPGDEQLSVKRSEGGATAMNKSVHFHDTDRVASSRTVRIFISSTFRDFAQERDLFVRTVFPELRRRCRERQVELIDVDLRWGITEEEAQQGKVLPICLAEIDRARPFFMGLLGERYGWVPAAGHFDRSLLTEQPWLEEHAGGKSVTELEILHGVLNNPEMAGRVFFYFRDRKWSEQQGKDCRTESEAERKQLADLKDRIRTSRFPVVEDYSNPEALAERVREDLWNLIDAAYPEADVPDQLTLERRRHEAYGGARRRLYLGGERYFEALDGELSAESPRPVLVRGRSGGGKSALVANWLARWSKTHPDTALIVHHLGCGADAADPVRMAVRIMQEIALLVGEEFKPMSDPEEQLDELASWLATASAWAGRTGRTVLVVLDGLDKLAERRDLRWLPMALPPGVRLVASCLDGEVLEAASPRLTWRELVVEPFVAAEQKQFIGEYLGRFRKQLTAEQARLLQSHPLVGNPLFLLTVLEELRVFGVHEELDKRLTTLLSPPPSKQPGAEPTVDDAFEHVLARIETDYGTEPVRRVMEAIWASRAGLYTDEILAITEVPPATWAGIANALDDSLYENGGRINFGHDYLRQAVEDRYGITGDPRLALHRRLAKHFTAQMPDARVAEELPWQWREANDKKALEECLTVRRIFEFSYEHDDHELLSYWLWLERDIDEAYQAAWKNWNLDQEDAVQAAFRLGNFMRGAGRYTDFCVELYSFCREWLRETYGPEAIETLNTANNLAGLLCDRGELEAAERIYRDSLQVKQRVLGQDHPETHRSAKGLAAVLYEQADYVAAEDLYRRVMRSQESTLGADNPETLETVDALGAVLDSQGRAEEAHSLLRRAMAGLTHRLGGSHPDTLGAMNNLAVILQGLSRNDEAERLLRHVIDHYDRIYGADHPLTLIGLSNLVRLLCDIGDAGAAEGLARRVWSTRHRILGTDHPSTIKAARTLAGVLMSQKEYAAAADMFRATIDASERISGAWHPDTLFGVFNLASVLAFVGEKNEAEFLFDRAVGGFAECLGEQHPHTKAAREQLAAIRTSDDDQPPSPIDSLPYPPGTVINSIGMKFVPISAGECLMGSPEDCPLGDAEEEFQHLVRITKPFLLGLHQVTQSQYEKVAGSNPSFFRGPDLPVEHLMWNEARRFCELLSDLPGERAAGRRYRLPNEAEWEYACRAGTTTIFNTGDKLDPQQARFATKRRSSPKPTAPVGSYPPNAWGLYDMHGNVWEWTSDWFSADYFRESPVDDPQGPVTGTHHTLRGGSASVEAHECRSTIRGEAHAVDGPETETGNRYPLYGDFGMRVVCEVA
jgi:formylglycine-generating enzyme required for sulfatase activity